MPADCVFAAKLRQQHRGVLRCLQCIGRLAKANGAQSRYGECRAFKIWQDPAEVRSLPLARSAEECHRHNEAPASAGAPNGPSCRTCLWSEVHPG